MKRRRKEPLNFRELHAKYGSWDNIRKCSVMRNGVLYLTYEPDGVTRIRQEPKEQPKDPIMRSRRQLVVGTIVAILAIEFLFVLIAYAVTR